MSFWENVSLALAGLKTSKMRAILTMLGIIIGVAAVIAIVTLGSSLTNSITSSMEDMGANQILVSLGAKESNSYPTVSASDKMTDEMITGLKQKMGNRIKAIMVTENVGSGQAKNGRRYANVTIFGVSANYVGDSNIDIIQGRDISQRDVNSGNRSAVVSDKFVEKIFPANSNPLGQEVKIETTNYGLLTFTIVGVYKYEIPAIMSSFVSKEDTATNFIIPISTAKQLTGSGSGYEGMSITYPTSENSYALTEKIEDYLNTYYRSNKIFMVRAQNMEGMLDSFATMMRTMSLAIGVIAAISLLVGGIGVMNIMLVSVTERTREIGTRKALGAKNSNIRAQFIIEAMILCLIGGLIGVVLGVGAGILGSMLLGFPASPPLYIIIIAVLFSMAIGVFFGYYPANKASKLDPIEALRYE